MIECPICGDTHLVEKRQRSTTAKIKDEIVEYVEMYYVCTEEGEAFEFTPAKMMDDNLLAARNAYRIAHNMMPSYEIASLRRKYGLTQKEFALLLGWGEITITRYETKLIQDETHDSILKSVRDNALEARKLLVRNSASFEENRYIEILKLIDAEIERTSVMYFARQKIEAMYIRYQGNTEATGGKTIDIDKVRNMILFFAANCKNLFKVKLMKLLWFSDALFSQRYNVSMSGLVYQHMPMGALPIAHWDLMDLVAVESIADDYATFDSYKILPSPDFSEDVFTTEEKDVLYTVLNKFRNFTGKSIAEYMHEELAYRQTREYEIIPFYLAKQIRPF